MKIKVLIADDHAIVRMGLASLFETENDIEIVGEAKNGNDVIVMTNKVTPDVVIMDLMMPKKDGVEATLEIHKRFPNIKIILLTTFGTSDGIAHALRNGASGAVLKSAAETELIPAIHKVINGEPYLSLEIQRQIKDDPPIPQLTPRQLDILSSLARGLTNKDIANQFGIRQDGVNIHVNAILQKLSAANRTEAVAIALRKHLLKGD